MDDPQAQGAVLQLSARVLGRHAPEGDDCDGLLHNPHLLIADEPTTAPDMMVQAQILELIDRIKDEANIGVILIIRDIGVIADLAQTVMVTPQRRPAVVYPFPVGCSFHPRRRSNPATRKVRR